MGLVSLAIIDKNDEPIYLKEFLNFSDGLNIERELLGASFVEGSVQGEGKTNQINCSLRHQFILHAALDQIEEISDPAMNLKWRAPGSSGADAMWVGLLCPADEFRVYGYITTTNLKFIAAVHDDVPPDQKPIQEAKEIDLKMLIANIHSVYVEYMLNPFNRIDGNVVSKRFDDRVRKLVADFNGVGKSVP